MFDCSKYDTDTEVIFIRLVPYFWIITPETEAEKTVWYSYLKLVSSVFKNLQVKIFDTCTDLHTFLGMDGQHLSLEKLLNDNYDNASRRIYITENNVSISTYVWFLTEETDSDNKVWYLTGETDPAPKDWYLNADYININMFTVYVPTALNGTFSEDEMTARLNNYVVNGYKFNIEYF